MSSFICNAVLARVELPGLRETFIRDIDPLLSPDGRPSVNNASEPLRTYVERCTSYKYVFR